MTMEGGFSRGKKIMGALMGAAAAGSPEAVAADFDKPGEIMRLDQRQYAELLAGLTPYQVENLEKAGGEFEVDASELRIRLHGFAAEGYSSPDTLTIAYGRGEKILNISIAEGMQVDSLTFTVYAGNQLHTIKFVRQP